MAEHDDVSATIEGLHRLLTQSILPELDRKQAAIQQLVADSTHAREAIREKLDQAEHAIAAPFDALDAGIGEIEAKLLLLDSALEPWTERVQGVATEQGTQSDAAITAVTTQYDHAGQAIEAGGTASGQAASEIEEVLQRLLGELVSVIEAVGGGAQEVAGRLTEGVQSITQAISSLDQELKSFRQEAEQTLQRFCDDTDTRASEVQNQIDQLFKECTQKLGELRTQTEGLLGDVATVADKVSDLFDGETRQAISNVQSLLKATEGIRQLLDAVKQWT